MCVHTHPRIALDTERISSSHLPMNPIDLSPLRRLICGSLQKVSIIAQTFIIISNCIMTELSPSRQICPRLETENCDHELVHTLAPPSAVIPRLFTGSSILLPNPAIVPRLFTSSSIYLNERLVHQRTHLHFGNFLNDRTLYHHVELLHQVGHVEVLLTLCSTEMSRTSAVLLLCGVVVWWCLSLSLSLSLSPSPLSPSLFSSRCVCCIQEPAQVCQVLG